MSFEPQVTPPDFELAGVPPSAVPRADVVALAVLPGAGGPSLGPGTAELVEAVADLPDLLDVLESAGATGAVGEVVEVGGVRRPGASGALLRVLLVGVGEATATDLRRAGATLARRTCDTDLVASAVSAVAEDDGLVAFVEGATLGAFSFSLRRAGPLRRPPGTVALAVTGEDSEAALARAVVRGRAGWTARMLASTPSNLKTPQWLADRAVEAARAAGLDTTVLDEQQLRERGFGGVVGVGQAAAAPPRFVEVAYRPSRKLAGRRKARHVVLVGKGITFDSGGLSIKPGQAMATMKRDMTGAAVVAAVMAALPAVDCPFRVTGLLPLAENAVGGNAMRPGDVITHVGGRTTEVTNTDAEGRLVLADALAYAVAELDPDVLVDVATLTGGVKVALGQHLGGLFATHDALARGLELAGERAGEPVWRLPLTQEYAAKLTSQVADADNAPGGPPAITAALFLEPFTGGVPWAHLDIASVGDAPEDSFEWTVGPTGFGPRLLLDWLADPDALTGVP